MRLGGGTYWDLTANATYWHTIGGQVARDGIDLSDVKVSLRLS